MFRRRPPLPVPARLIKRLPMAVIDLANPTRFLTLVNRVLPWLAAATVLLFAFGLARAMNAPDDYQQGATVKIMFLHVPAAWLSMMGWGLMSAFAKDAKQGRPGDFRLALLPKQPQSAYKSILFIVDPKEFLVRESVLVDSQGNTNHFTFDGLEVNGKVADAVFKWTPPAGVRVVDMGQMNK